MMDSTLSAPEAQDLPQLRASHRDCRGALPFLSRLLFTHQRWVARSGVRPTVGSLVEGSVAVAAQARITATVRIQKRAIYVAVHRGKIIQTLLGRNFLCGGIGRRRRSPRLQDIRAMRRCGASRQAGLASDRRSCTPTKAPITSGAEHI